MSSHDFEVYGHLHLDSRTAEDVNSGRIAHASASQLVAEKFMIQHKSSIENRFKQQMSHEFKIADRYIHVGVLILRWDDELDNLRTNSEVQELHNLFENDFKFSSHVVALDVKTRPQSQLNHAVSSLVRFHDGPCRNNLLIVYYSGHGEGVQDQHDLYFSGSRSTTCPSPEETPYDARVNWNRAEVELDDAEADVLLIFDCCNAANIIKKSSRTGHRCHELLAASGRDELAQRPGKDSFTRHFIDALREELISKSRQPFSTYDLNEAVMRRRQNFSSHLLDRHGGRPGRHISLAPLDHITRPNDAGAGGVPSSMSRIISTSATLDLRLVFKTNTMLEEDAAGTLAQRLSQAARKADEEHNMGLFSIDWMAYQPSANAMLLRHYRTSARKIQFARQWLDIVRRRKEKKRKLEADAAEEMQPESESGREKSSKRQELALASDIQTPRSPSATSHVTSP